MKHARQFISSHSKTLLYGVFVAIACYFLYWFQLGTLLPGASIHEVHFSAEALNIHNIVHNPLNAPYKLIDFLFLHINAHSLFWARAASAVFATLASGLFFFIVRRWHGRNIAILTTLLFSTTSWLLHSGRLATATNITVMLIPLVLIWLLGWLKNGGAKHKVALPITVISIGLLLYTPAAVWFVGLAFLWNAPYLKERFKSNPAWQKTVAILGLLIMLAPLACATYRTPGLARSWAGIPLRVSSVLTVARHAADSLAYLFLRGPYDPQIWLGHLPLLDIFATVVCGIGIYFYATHARNHVQRLKMLGSFAVMAAILIALYSIIFVGVLIPIAYIFASTGIAYLLRQWYAVFPRNPVARGVGLVLLLVTVGLAITYQTSAYFLAWQHNPDTIKVFQHKL